MFVRLSRGSIKKRTITTRLFQRSTPRLSAPAWSRLVSSGRISNDFTPGPRKFSSLANDVPLKNFEANVLSRIDDTELVLHDKYLTVERTDTKELQSYPYTWLYDACRCSKCVHAENHQKLKTPGQVDPSIHPRSVTNEESIFNYFGKEANRKEQGIRIKWDVNERGSHESFFSYKWLFENPAVLLNQKKGKIHGVGNQTLWGKKEYGELEFIEYSAFIDSNGGLEKVLKRLNEYGLVFLKNVPTTREEVLKLGRRIGTIMDTFYGPSWDVVSTTNSKNIAYTDLYLGYHMDLCYYEAPPGIQILHCLENNVLGGASFFADSFKTANILQAENKEMFDVLATQPVNFHYISESQHMYDTKSTIVVNGSGEVIGVNYSPPFMTNTQFDSVNSSISFYQAFARFEEILAREELKVSHLMKAGEAMLFNNRRVLHARNSFDSSSGTRHFMGTYISLDEFYSRLRNVLPM
ncbi:Trimethyllysine dioxygenase, mitochondrial [Smittium mucronatum]|uniref:Trimethyllysine dioxygenase, mitochondrial n=1 Tax=Smittium mucronatum TaxID=133383 RepID=A0A1R0H1Y6_9FUNG|nr:Trimethyllysine dioxygenase, mitochondrial [Smittium mucronatum]